MRSMEEGLSARREVRPSASLRAPPPPLAVPLPCRAGEDFYTNASTLSTKRPTEIGFDT
jgi:hypothetical protein